MSSIRVRLSMILLGDNETMVKQRETTLSWSLFVCIKGLSVELFLELFERI